MLLRLETAYESEAARAARHAMVEARHDYTRLLNLFQLVGGHDLWLAACEARSRLEAAEDQAAAEGIAYDPYNLTPEEY